MQSRATLAEMSRRIAPALEARGWLRFRGDFAYWHPVENDCVVVYGIGSKWGYEASGGLELAFDVARMAKPRRPQGWEAKRLTEVLGPSDVRREWVALRDEMIRVAQQNGRAMEARILGSDRSENFYFDVWMWLNREEDVDRWLPVLERALEAVLAR